MKLMKKFMKKHEGFTLVELIVVIAILAILAGVAIPVYSGYIKKANSAADLQLLDAVNTAFAAACLANGVDARDIEKAMFDKNTMKVFDVKLNGAVNTEIAADFDTYFAGNAEAEFKTYLGLVFSEGRFVEGSGNMTMEQIQAAVDRYNTSNFAGNEEELVGSVGTLSGMLGEQIDDGLDISGFLEEDYDGFMEKYGLTSESGGTEIANATIMYTASKLQGVTAQDIIDLAGGNFNNMDAVTETYGMIPTAAMMYGVISGYANSEYASDDFKTAYQTPPDGISAVTDLVSTMTSDPNFTTYLNKSGDSGATADIDGFLAAMEVINAHDGSFDLSDPNAFTNEETLALLNSILGK